MVLLTSVVAFAQHEVGGGSTSDSATSSDPSRGGSRSGARPFDRRAAPHAGPQFARLTAEQYNQQGDTFFGPNNTTKRSRLINKAVQLKPIAAAFYHIGWIYNEREDYEQALTALQQAIRLNPNYATRITRSVLRYRNLKRYDEALLAYPAHDQH